MSRSVRRPLAYQRRYGYRFRDALRAEFWWRVEHVGPKVGALGGIVRGFGYAKRKQAEQAAQPFRRPA